MMRLSFNPSADAADKLLSGGSISAGKQNTNSHYKSVNEQTGILAGNARDI